MSKFHKDFYMCYNVLQTNGGNKNDSQMVVLVENRMCPPSLEERAVGSFRTQICLCIPHMLAGKSSTIRLQEMDWGWVITDQAPHLLSSFNSADSIPSIMYFHMSSLQQDNRISVGTE